MRYSKIFSKTRKIAPSEADTVNHKLLVQAGFVRQVMAGVYTYLPLGLRVLNKISNIIREEMNSIGGQEVLMPSMHPSNLWKQTGGWDSIDVLFKVKSRTDKEYALAQSHEETVTPLAKEFINSYKDLPLAIYHIQWKYRDELRAKSGILRGREFLMKDLYSWHANQEDFDRYYKEVKEAYLRIFNRLGLTAKVTEASGGAFTDKISYEFEVLSDAGEANILYCSKCEFCVNVDDIEKHKDGEKCPKCGKSELKTAKAAEVGNVFDLGQKYTKAFDLKFSNENGDMGYPIMGCYGIGISRTMGVLVEKYHDEKGMMWPVEASPFDVSLISLNTEKTEVKEKASNIYKKLLSEGIEVLYDDRDDVGAGQKLSDSDLIGNPVRLVVSAKTGDEVEVKLRNEEQALNMSLDDAISRIKSIISQ